MKCREILDLLEKEYPIECAEEWDNPGLLLGDENVAVDKIMVALDAVDSVIEQAARENVQLLVTHHPLIFSSVRQINNRSVNGRRILKLAQKGIACYAMHTNFDIRGMAQINEEQLGLKECSVLFQTGEKDGKEEGIGRVGRLSEKMTLAELSEHVKASFQISGVLCYGKADLLVERAAVSSGSGKSMVKSACKAGAQVLITGDIDYHTAIDAMEDGLAIIDAGHYGTEYIFIEYMTKKLRKLCPSCEIIPAKQEEPFRIV